MIQYHTYTITPPHHSHAFVGASGRFIGFTERLNVSEIKQSHTPHAAMAAVHLRLAEREVYATDPKEVQVISMVEIAK